jgi:hypothetical protein
MICAATRQEMDGNEAPSCDYDAIQEMRAQTFEHHRAAMDQVRALGLPVSVCTIYDCDFTYRPAYAARAALALFNDVIIRYALSHGLDIIELRDVCTIPADFEMDIEPSREGAQKIAAALAGAITEVIAQRVTA